jgi:hypothetical protein
VFTASANVGLPFQLAALVRFRSTGGAFLDDDNQYPIDGPEVVDIRVRRRFGRYTYFIDVLNSTDKGYEEYGFTLPDFAGRVVSYVYPGSPRSIRVGVATSF